MHYATCREKSKIGAALLPDLEVKCLLPSILPRPQQSRQLGFEIKKSLEL